MGITTGTTVNFIYYDTVIDDSAGMNIVNMLILQHIELTDVVFDSICIINI